MKHNIATILLIISIAILSYFHFGSSIYWIVLSLLLIGFVSLIVIGSSVLSFNYFVKSINKGQGEGVSLTFDDGPDEFLTPKILNILDDYKVKATFFLIGENVKKHPELTKEIIKRGHIIGNHSYSHDRKIALFSTSKLTSDIEKCKEVLYKIAGKNCIYFRAPFGVTTPRFSRAINRTGIQSFGWSLRSMDTVAKSKEQLLTKLSGNVKSGDIILLHDNCAVTVEALPDFLSFCDKKGIIIVPLNENTRTTPYA